MAALMGITGRHKQAVIEDCAQSHGVSLNERRLGIFENAAASSLYPTKDLRFIGEGGREGVRGECERLG
jgi:dTDP-4-amino-4,6-dideoxygalactose transaminase